MAIPPIAPLAGPAAARCAPRGRRQLLLAALATGLAARYFLRRIGGYTGDCLGATQQLSELAIYVGLHLAWTFS